MTIKRLRDFEKIERLLIHKMWQKVRHIYKDGQWHEFKGKFKIQDRIYEFECIFLLDQNFLTLKKKTVRDPNSKIIVPAHYN